MIGAEILSRVTDPDDKRTAALFGDGAGAVVLGPDGRGRDRPDPARLRRRHGATRSSPPTTSAASTWTATRRSTRPSRCSSESTREACERAGLTLDDIDLFVYHQANGRILRAVGEKLELPAERVADYVGETGNTSAASIPLTLSLLREDGRLRPGPAAAARRRRRRLHLGRRASSSGGCASDGPPRGSRRARHRRVQGHRRRDRQGAGRRRLARRGQLPLRRGRRARRPWRRSRRPAARAAALARRRRQRRARRALQRRRGGARRPGARARQQRRRARGQPRDPDRGRGLGHASSTRT